ncbi:hypothetical protein V2J09_003574 [Rumex salicifolius]
MGVTEKSFNRWLWKLGPELQKRVALWVSSQGCHEHKPLQSLEQPLSHPLYLPPGLNKGQGLQQEESAHQCSTESTALSPFLKLPLGPMETVP